METEIQKKKRKTPSSTDSLRIKRTTKKDIVDLVKQLNKEKSVGRSIQPYQVVELAFSLIEPRHLEQLKEQSLTNEDRLEQNYQNYIRQHGPISKDEYFGILLKQTKDLPAVSHVSKGLEAGKHPENQIENRTNLASSDTKVVL